MPRVTSITRTAIPTIRKVILDCGSRHMFLRTDEHVTLAVNSVMACEACLRNEQMIRSVTPITSRGRMTTGATLRLECGCEQDISILPPFTPQTISMVLGTTIRCTKCR